MACYNGYRTVAPGYTGQEITNFNILLVLRTIAIDYTGQQEWEKKKKIIPVPIE